MTLKAVSSLSVVRLPKHIFEGFRRRIAQTNQFDYEFVHDGEENGVLIGNLVFLPDKDLELSSAGEFDGLDIKAPDIERKAYATVLETLQDAMNSINDGSITPDKIAIVCLDNSHENSYTINWFQGGMRYTEITLLMTITQHKFMAMLESSCGHRMDEKVK